MEASKNFTLLIHQLRCSSSRSDHSETQMRKNERPVGAGTRIDLISIDKRSNGPGLTFLSSCQSSFFEAISSRFDGDRFQMTRHIFFLLPQLCVSHRICFYSLSRYSRRPSCSARSSSTQGRKQPLRHFNYATIISAFWLMISFDGLTRPSRF